jgi:hypothetical protein
MKKPAPDFNFNAAGDTPSYTIWPFRLLIEMLAPVGEDPMSNGHELLLTIEAQLQSSGRVKRMTSFPIKVFTAFWVW